MKPNYRAMITGNPGIKAEARKLGGKGIMKIGKSDQIKRALKNQGIRVVATNRDGDLQLDMGYLLQMNCWKKHTFILWKRTPKIPTGRMETAYTVSGKNWADHLARLVGGNQPMLITY